MCCECKAKGVNRRNLFKLAGVGLTAVTLAGPRPARASSLPSGPVTTPEDALARLKAGNRRFVDDVEACTSNHAALRGELSGGQSPWATILTCSDSRVSPELVFGGATIGELFVIRNAGNVLDTGALGTIEYGTEHLKSPLVVVMGHSKCGAVSAACEVVQNGTHLGGSIGKMIQPILPIALARRATSRDLVAETVRDNAIAGARRITEESEMVNELVAGQSVQIVAAVYDISTGHVDFIEDLR